MPAASEASVQQELRSEEIGIRSIFAIREQRYGDEARRRRSTLQGAMRRNCEPRAEAPTVPCRQFAAIPVAPGLGSVLDTTSAPRLARRLAAAGGCHRGRQIGHDDLGKTSYRRFPGIAMTPS